MKHEFQVLPPAKGHQRNKLIMDTLAQFQVMPPQGGIHCGDYLVFLEDEFQVIPPRGDIPSSICLDIPTCSFKSFPREGDAPAGYGAPRGVADSLLVASGRWVAAGTWDFPLRAKRALKEGVVIRKRQGEPGFPLLLCARRPRRPQLFPRFVKTDIGTPPRAPTGWDRPCLLFPAAITPTGR